MSEIILDCKRHNNDQSQPALVGNLLTLKIQPSQYLKIFYVVAHSLFFVAITLAIMPFIETQPLWLLLWLAVFMLVFINFTMLNNSRSKDYWCLILNEDGWWLSHNNSVLFSVELSGDILLWQSVICLQFIDRNSSKIYQLLLLRDSADKESLRCLRVWLVTKFSY